MSRQPYRVTVRTHGYVLPRRWGAWESPYGLRISMWCPACKLATHQLVVSLRHAFDTAHDHASTCPALRAANANPAFAAALRLPTSTKPEGHSA